MCRFIGFLASGSPSFKKKVSVNLSLSSQPDIKGSGETAITSLMQHHCIIVDDFADLDFLSQQPPALALSNLSTLGLPDLPHSLSQPSSSFEDSAFSSTVGSPTPSYIKTTPITTAYELTLEELGR